ncbi:AIG2-like protein D isoform X2 [Malania oleifera]|uniref:AIG2-like protein D isoform X2 n=1 Tax=Malania oleifera TaxID=397392 RepID=UPI0025AE12BE|nr:AIG2-like protein D isoform X2 [Malania oleifera]
MESAAGTQAPQSLHNVFVYGSLMTDEVVKVLLKRLTQSSPAILNHHHRFSIKGRVYPAILPVENMTVTGRVLLGITAPELHILDTFEDVEYERSSVEVSLMDCSEKLQANAYIWANKNDPNLYGDWDFEEVNFFQWCGTGKSMIDLHYLIHQKDASLNMIGCHTKSSA